LLLISRYREELGHIADHRAALRVAVRNAGPAILASNTTVVLALLTLVFASSPSTRSLGVQAASGLVSPQSSYCWCFRPCWRCAGRGCSGHSSPTPAPNPLPAAGFGTASPPRWPADPAA
jgi:putative drug exporter of the RND superfamily